MNTIQTKKYAFVLGREIEICLAELRATLNRFGFYFDDLILTDNVAFINLSKNPAKLIDILGGTIKIFEIIEFEGEIKSLVAKLILERSSGSGKFNFGFSAYGRHRAAALNPLGLAIKKELKNKLSLRFLALKEKELTTIVSSKNKLATSGLELGFFNDLTGMLIAVTDPESWSERDYGKPRGDKFSGMVPPKLARIMVNLALGETQVPSTRDSGLDTPPASLVVDPFCGSGNILLEALMLGCDVLGSDVSERAVEDSKANVEWLTTVHSSQYAVHSKYNIIQADATNSGLSENWGLSTEDYDGFAIVTEPYLGEPKKFIPSLNAVMGEYAKIRDLYLKFLSNLSELRNPNSELVLCLVFPLVETLEGRRYSLYENSVDEIRKIGYTALASPLVYGREYQVVKREIVLLKI